MKNLPKIDQGLSFFEKFIQFEQKYGAIRIIKTLFVILVGSLILRVVYNPRLFSENLSNIVQSEIFIKQSDTLKNAMYKYLDKYGADRIWMIYPSQLTNWQCKKTKYELYRNGTLLIEKEFENNRTSWLNSNYLKEKSLYIGDLESVKSVDVDLYNRFNSDSANYVAWILIRDSERFPIGIFGVTWQKTPNEIDDKKNEIRNYLIEDRNFIKSLLKINK